MQTQPRRYTPVATLAGRGTAAEFRKSLRGVAVGAGSVVHALGDGEVRVFHANGGVARAWKAPDQASCLAVAPDGRVLVGAPGRVEILTAAGSRAGGFSVGQAGKPSDVTAIKVFRDNILVADAGARLVRRYDANGIERGLIGNQLKTGSFMLPNRSLDIDVDASGVVYATDTGRHRVTAWRLDGTPVGSFGRWGQQKPEDFVGCCNPVNLAVAPDGCVVTGEKVAARVKVFGPDRVLLAVVGPEHFDPMCIHIHLAVDSSGRIVAADPVRRTITIFGQS